MRARRPLLPVLCLVATSLALTACFGSSSSGPPLPIAVSFSAQPPTSVNVGGSFAITADVFNGSSTEKVNWSCTPVGACGSFNPAQTTTGIATTYTAPATVPAGGSVTISATSLTDMTKSAVANLTVSPGGTITVTFNAPAPPPTLTVSGVAQVSATITSTVMNAVSDGIDWTATCTNSAGGGCGQFSSAHTASGSSMTYTAPPTAPAAGVAITITAASTLDPQDTVTAVITVVSTQTSAFLCAGCAYTYTFSGTGANGTFGAAGVILADGMGNIMGGEQDYGDFGFSTGNTPDVIQAGSTYQFGPDGRGTIVLNTGDANIGNNGVETLGVVFVSSNHLLITELDASATASGTMDLQTAGSFSPSTLSGNYVFVFSGADLTFGDPLGFGGVFNVTSPGNISGAGSTSDANDGGFLATQKSLSGNFVVSDQFGRIKLTLNSGVVGALQLSGPIVMAGYVADATHVKFVEVDPNFGVTSGVAVGQGAASGTLTGASALPANSSYVFTSFGEGVTGPIALATTFTSDGSSMLQNGSSDVNAAGVPSSGNLSGTYSVDAAGTGRVAVTLNGNVGNPGNTAAYAVYLTGGPDPAMILELDNTAVTSGTQFKQAAGPFTLASFKGAYGLNFTLFDPTGSIEVDASGQSFADGAGNLLGTLDINNFGTPIANQAFTGAYASAASGRFTGSITSVATGTLGVSYFVVSPNQIVFIETDSNNAVSLGVFQLQTPPF
ncbi:MAG TPA: hypothetical protein VMI93_05835 [Candidatus Solibacter sp.]|nr:hypothetical protein [Candidatus Solibacter sp.]